MVIKNLHFFDSNGYNLNFDWNDNGYWEGSIYLPKVSVGLYANSSIYILEKISDNFYFPNGTGKIKFTWDTVNSFVDEFFMFNFDETYRIKETSALVYTPNDGPDCNTLIVNRFDEYEIPLTGAPLRKALPVHIAFMANEKFDATTYNRTLIMSYGGNTIARIKFYAETVEEDERLKIWNQNLGYNITPEDEMIFYKSDIKEYKPDYILLNEKRKELMLEGSNIYPYIGSYRAIINAIKFFGYDNLNIIEFWRNVNPDDVNFGKIYHSSKYSLTKKETLRIGTRNIVLPNKDFKKINQLALVYSINKPTNEVDEEDLPTVKEQFEYTLEEALIKLFALRKKLNKEFMPGSSKIIDIIGEGNYFGSYNLVKVHDSVHIEEIEKDKIDYADFDVNPRQTIHITDNEYFNRYINLRRALENSTDPDITQQLLSDILDMNVSDLPSGDISINISEETLYTLRNDIKCEYFKQYNEDVILNQLLEKKILDNDDYPYNSPEYTYTGDPYRRFSAKTILYNTSFEPITFGECDYKFEYNGGVTPITFNSIDTINQPDIISWKITMSENQVDDDLRKLGVVKEYKYHNLDTLDTGYVKKYTKTNESTTIFNEFFVELPYIGYYDVTMELGYSDNPSQTQTKTKKKFIKVEPYQIDLIGFYYDARELPEELQYNNEEGTEIYNFIQENIEKLTGWATAERTSDSIAPEFSMPIYTVSGEVLNPGPYLSRYVDDEWYLADNVNSEIAWLKPNAKYARYIRNCVDVKPYTWFLLGYDYSKIVGKINPRWTITNQSGNAPYYNIDGHWVIGSVDTGITNGNFKPYVGNNGNWFIGSTDTGVKSYGITKYFNGKYLTLLLKHEGEYVVSLTLDDKNGNSYEITKSIIVVSKSANYGLYNSFKKDYEEYVMEQDILKLNEYYLINDSTPSYAPPPYNPDEEMDPPVVHYVDIEGIISYEPETIDVNIEGNVSYGPNHVDVEIEGLVYPVDVIDVNVVGTISYEPDDVNVNITGSIYYDPDIVNVGVEGIISYEPANVDVDIEGIISYVPDDVDVDIDGIISYVPDDVDVDIEGELYYVNHIDVDVEGVISYEPANVDVDTEGIISYTPDDVDVDIEGVISYEPATIDVDIEGVISYEPATIDVDVEGVISYEPTTIDVDTEGIISYTPDDVYVDIEGVISYEPATIDVDVEGTLTYEDENVEISVVEPLVKDITGGNVYQTKSETSDFPILIKNAQNRKINYTMNISNMDTHSNPDNTYPFSSIVNDQIDIYNNNNDYQYSMFLCHKPGYTSGELKDTYGRFTISSENANNSPYVDVRASMGVQHESIVRNSGGGGSYSCIQIVPNTGFSNKQISLCGLADGAAEINGNTVKYYDARYETLKVSRVYTCYKNYLESDYPDDLFDYGFDTYEMIPGNLNLNIGSTTSTLTYSIVANSSNRLKFGVVRLGSEYNIPPLHYNSASDRDFTCAILQESSNLRFAILSQNINGDCINSSNYIYNSDRSRLQLIDLSNSNAGYKYTLLGEHYLVFLSNDITNYITVKAINGTGLTNTIRSGRTGYQFTANDYSSDYGFEIEINNNNFNQ